jgi:hypothetical protein
MERVVSAAAANRLREDCRGAIFVETLIAYAPVLYLFFATWQIAELCAANLIVRRATSAAARAAVVVLPDDPVFYDGVAVHSFSGKRRDAVRMAAGLILAASPQISDDFQVDVAGTGQAGTPTKVAVTATFRCAGGWLSLVCGAGGQRRISATTTQAYHGASYQY